MTEVYTLDLNFLGIPHVITSYLIKHGRGAVIIESGPGSTIDGLKTALATHELTVDDVTDVLLTGRPAGWRAMPIAGRGLTSMCTPTARRIC
jgi:hypothetical protein